MWYCHKQSGRIILVNNQYIEVIIDNVNLASLLYEVVSCWTLQDQSHGQCKQGAVLAYGDHVHTNKQTTR